MITLTIRPDSWNLPLLLHVGGAMLLVGAVTVAAAVLLLAWKRADPTEAAALTRFGFWTLLLAVLPSYVLMRVGAQWIASREHLENSDATWIGIGFGTADTGLLVLIAAIVIVGIGVRRLGSGPVGRSVLGRIGAVLALLLLVAYIVAVWAMTTKPT
ncbi:MAG TPA: hypothetical protein VE777_13670 [Gaiellales bacterium]|jgi:hypothetical protein|nr:hypothetical protein [Gaiellales bacterium]